jgi:hypothetical protein
MPNYVHLQVQFLTAGSGWRRGRPGCGPGRVAEGDSGCSADERGSAEEPSGKAAVEFHDPLHPLHTAAAAKQAKSSPKKPEEGPGGGPEVSREFEHGESEKWRNSKVEWRMTGD